LVVLLLAAQTFPAAVRFCFCAPSAWLSAQFLGVSLIPLADGFRLDCPQLPVDVSLACSGMTFFAMLLVLITSTEFGRSRGGPRAEARHPAPLAGPGTFLALAYGITLAANTARIVLGWHAAVWAHAALQVSFHSGVHLAVGIVVFSGFLVIAVLAMKFTPQGLAPIVVSVPSQDSPRAKCNVGSTSSSTSMQAPDMVHALPAPNPIQLSSSLASQPQADRDIRPTLRSAPSIAGHSPSTP